MEYLWFLRENHGISMANGISMVNGNLRENHGISMVNGISMEYLWLMET